MHVFYIHFYGTYEEVCEALSHRHHDSLEKNHLNNCLEQYSIHTTHLRIMTVPRVCYYGFVELFQGFLLCVISYVILVDMVLVVTHFIFYISFDICRLIVLVVGVSFSTKKEVAQTRTSPFY